ncbi:zinc-dependent alcohol dehydrogenase [Salinigranum salinum]|uniref:zinc-dependent alcohol dehydrogenase n=1 Tax=Salinigranum salinum TaxID=1364937 RepID=UPI001261133C|nr:alcohol dehydrogenase catalytic domain-containing protein [Salinigranum salinum]
MDGLAKTAGSHGNIELLERPKPAPGPDEALVEVAYAGLCGSDLGIYTFKDAFSFMEFPRIVGHEYAGTVVETGERVTRFDVGDRVVEMPIRSCGDCYHCLSGAPNLCIDAHITGIHHDGAFTEYVAVPEAHLHHVPDDLSLATASIVEPTSVAIRAVKRRSRVGAGDRVLVEGPGPIGLLTAQIARAQGGEVIVSGVGKDAAVRLPIARELGFEAVDVSETDIGTVADERTDGLGFDVVLDSTGHPSGLETAADVTRKGGQIVVVGLGGLAELDYAALLRAELDVQCSYASDWEDFERALYVLESGAVESEVLVETGYSLRDGVEAFEAAYDAAACKIRFDISELRT